jgi:hypothetical protein
MSSKYLHYSRASELFVHATSHLIQLRESYTPLPTFQRQYNHHRSGLYASLMVIICILFEVRG